jgi:hypothetical protein
VRVGRNSRAVYSRGSHHLQQRATRLAIACAADVAARSATAHPSAVAVAPARPCRAVSCTANVATVAAGCTSAHSSAAAVALTFRRLLTAGNTHQFAHPARGGPLLVP